MKVNIDIDEKYEETFITIHAKEWTKGLEELIRNINHQTPKRIVGMREDKSILLSPNEIDFVYAQNRKVYASINKHSIELNMKLYEIESLLQGFDFTRFSKSVIGNLNQIKYFELGFNGNIYVCFFIRGVRNMYLENTC